ncbi:MAG: radical SAM protein [Desulfobacterales bacterium]|jgi:MoaA/NifB/PqqE/SkfB family radical SAM enzyme|nr:radical SAM protein [Desulfobacterales bacterium]
MKNTKSLYGNLKFIAFPDHLKALEEDRLVAPAHIRIKPINACNHDCWYCAYHVDWLKLGELMEHKDIIPKEKMFEIIDDIVEMGVKAVTFSGGGEPLMYPHISQCVKIFAEGGVSVAALTNGSNLKGKVADAFAEHADWVRISMDAWDGPSYARARNVKENEFEKVVANIRDFAARKSSCVIGISFIIQQDNSEHIFEFVSMMKDAGVNHVSLSGCVVSNSGLEVNEYHDKIRGAVQEQIRRSLLLECTDFKVVDNYHDLDERFDKDYKTCPFLQFKVVIGADCKVYACQDKAYTAEGLLGSLENESFKGFWFSEENKKAMKAVDPSLHCNHHCVADKKIRMILDYVNMDKKNINFV